MNETNRLYTRDGIKTIDYEVHLKLQKAYDEMEKEYKECLKARLNHVGTISELEHRVEKQMILIQGEYDRSERLRRELEELSEVHASTTERLSRAEHWKDKWQTNWINLNEKYQTLREALRTIKHTDCDTYKIAARALCATREIDKDGE